MVCVCADTCAGQVSINSGGVGGCRRLVEAKYPALLFKHQVEAFVRKIFPMMRDNVKKNITPMLVSFVVPQAFYCLSYVGRSKTAHMSLRFWEAPVGPAGMFHATADHSCDCVC